MHELVSKPRRRRRIVIVIVLDIGVMSVMSDVAMMICKPADSTMHDARCTMPATIDDRDRVNVVRRVPGDRTGRDVEAQDIARAARLGLRTFADCDYRLRDGDEYALRNLYETFGSR